MFKYIAQFLILATFVVSATWYGMQQLIDKELKKMLPKAEFIRELTQEEQAKVYLYNLVLESGMRYRDFLILREVIKCESGWRHFGKDGEVVISSGNIGYGQINRLVWYDFFKAMKIDIYEWQGNLKAAVWLYQNYGLKPWYRWSGHCWGKYVKNLKK